MSAGKSPQSPHRDPGLQPERTSLAWQRTAVSGLLLSLVALGAASHRLVVHTGPAGGPTVLPALTVVVTAAAAVLAAVDAVVVVPAVVHGLAHHPTSTPLASPRARLLLMMATTVLLGLAGALLAASGLAPSVASSGA